MSTPTPSAPREMQQFEALLTKRDVLLLPYSDSQSEAWERADIALRAFVASLAKDSQRLTFAEDNAHLLRHGADCDKVFTRGEDGHEFRGETWRQALDAAMTGGEKS